MRYILPVLIIVLTIFSLGCSSTNILTPKIQDTPQMQGEIPAPPLYVSELDSSGNPTAGMGIMGVYSGHLSVDSLTGELIPVRSNSLTDTLEVVDITNFMKLAPCVDCVKLRGIQLDSDGHAIASIGIRHPFPAGDPFKPISGRNRADLHVFNVEGIVAVQGSSTNDFTGLGVKVSGFGLDNPDGYTGYLDTYLDEILPTDATVHPYIMHFDDYSQGNFNPTSPTGFESVTNPPPSGNLVMPMGSDYDFKDYVFNLPADDSIDFIFAVGCTYAVSSSAKALRFNPEYRVPQHNKKAASEVRVEVTSNDLLAGNTSSTADLKISVLDINNGIIVGPGLDQMAFESSVSGIQIEIPGVISGIESNYSFVGGNGRDPSNPITYTTTVTNSAGGAMGTYSGLVKVTDSYPTGQNQSPLLSGNDGIKRVDPLLNPLAGTFSIPEFATYTTFEIKIESAEPQDPIAIIVTIPDPPTIGTTDPWIIFDGSQSYDPDGGPITLYEWDFEWDGDPANFIPDVIGPDAVIDHYYTCIEAVHTAALRVTDDDTPAGISQIASVQVTVTNDFIPGEWEDPANLGGQRINGDHLYMTGQMLNVDSNGLVHIITHDFGSIYHRTFDGTTLSDFEIVPGPSGVNMVTSALDASDELHIVWQSGYPEQTIKHTQTSGGTFTGTVDDLSVSDPGYSTEMTNIQRNNDGDLMITSINYDADKVDVHWKYMLNEGSGFSATQNVPYIINIRRGTGPNPSYTNLAPNLIATPNGYFHQIYYANEADLNYNVITYDLVFNGTEWIAPRVAFDDPGYGTMYDIHAAAGENGDIHITGIMDTSYYVRYVRYDAASDTWMPIKNVTTNNKSYCYGAVEVDNGGYVHLVYACSSDNLLHMKIFCSWCDEETILATPDTVVDNTTINQDHCYADLAWDKDGNLLALYTDTMSSPMYTYFNRLMY